MPRHENTPLHADSRLNRRGPDVLPTHRQCSGCSKVMPLTVEYFYEDSSRYPWNLSRFRFVCRACSVRIGGELRAKRKVERNTQTRARRAQVKRNAKMARAYGSGTASSDALRIELAAQTNARKVRIAWFKRQTNRLRGPYQDPIKRIIRLNQESYSSNALTRLGSSVLLPSIENATRKNDDANQYQKQLEEIRAAHLHIR